MQEQDVEDALEKYSPQKPDLKLVKISRTSSMGSSEGAGNKWEDIDTEDLHHLDGILDDPPFKELWASIVQRHKLKGESPYSGYSSYRLRPVIVKANDDLR